MSTLANEWLTNGIEPFVVDLHVEDPAAAGGHVDRLDAVERVGWIHVAVDVGGVEDRADHVECRRQARAGVDDVEANGVARVGGERMRDVLAGVAVEGRPVGHDRPRLVHVELGRSVEAVAR